MYVKVVARFQFYNLLELMILTYIIKYISTLSTLAIALALTGLPFRTTGADAFRWHIFEIIEIYMCTVRLK